MAGAVERCGTVVVGVGMDSLLLGHHHKAPAEDPVDILHHLGERIVAGALHMESGLEAAGGIRGLPGGVRVEDSLAGLEVLVEVDHIGRDAQEVVDYIDLEEGARRSLGAAVEDTEREDGPEGHRKDTEVDSAGGKVDYTT